jgi:hypothetical protein
LSDAEATGVKDSAPDEAGAIRRALIGSFIGSAAALGLDAIVPNDGAGFVFRNKPAVKQNIVTLCEDERTQLASLIQTGKHPARTMMITCILLNADASDDSEGWSDSQIAAAPEPSTDTVSRTRQRLVEEGL